MQRWVGLFLGLCLLSATQAYAQRAGGGGGGGGGRRFWHGGGGFGNFGRRRRNAAELAAAAAAAPARIQSIRTAPSWGLPRSALIRRRAVWSSLRMMKPSRKSTTLSPSLDRPKPQVLIKVVFLEVTHSDDLDFGVEGSYSHNPSSVIIQSLRSEQHFWTCRPGRDRFHHRPDHHADRARASIRSWATISPQRSGPLLRRKRSMCCRAPPSWCATTSRRRSPWASPFRSSPA